MMDVCGRNRTRTIHQAGRRNRGQVCLLLASIGFTLLVLSPGALADQVTMANGDVITGEILTLKEGKLTIKTPYNEALEIAWGSIEKIRSEKPVEVVLKDDTRLQGTLQVSEEGVLQVVTESAGPVAIGEMVLITDINPPVAPAVTYHGNLEAGVSYLTGNSETASGNLSGLFVARSKRQRFTLRANWNYAENDKVVNARNAGGSLKYDFFVTQKFYAYANTLFLYDPFQDLDLRSTIGGGCGYQFWDDVRKKLSFELGISYVDQNYRIAEDDAYAGGRWSIDFSYWLIKEKIKLFHFEEGYFSLEDFKDMNLITEQGVRFMVLKDFYSSIQVNVSYDNEPSPGFKSTDTALIFGLGYHFDL